MKTTRRVFLALAGPLVFLLATLGRRRLAWAQPAWQVRRATPEDAAEVAAVFDAHRQAGLCPYSDLIAPWTSAAAAAYLRVFNGTQLVARDGRLVACGALIDYTNPATPSRLAPGGAPEVGIVALDVGYLTGPELVRAAKHLAAALARELQRQGFARCQMRMPAVAVLGTNEWYIRHRTVLRTRTRDGVDYALEVQFDVEGGLATLAAEGY